jgi:predicted enzyme related to lactoylglutathione lyase
MKPIGMHLSWIIVSDINSAVKFCTEIMGLELCEFNENFGWAEFSGKDGARLGVAQVNAQLDQKAGSNAVVTITVNDIEKAREELLLKKVRLIDGIIEVPGEVKMQTFKDADGNTFQLCQMLK